jgi:hypothetical protein
MELVHSSLQVPTFSKFLREIADEKLCGRSETLHGQAFRLDNPSTSASRTAEVTEE